jgi:16S rRNA (cytosine1402-N4)-methyltransferase
MTHTDNDTVTEQIRFHKPVLVQEVLEYLNPQPGKMYLDVTFGTGGHTKAILDREPNCSVIALDWDHVTLDKYGALLQEQYGDRLTLIWGNFALLYKILKKEKINKVDGILADFGTSQIQIADRPGLSIYKEAWLDMRMSPPHQQMTAAMIVNKASEEKLREIFWQLGEELRAKQIAAAIIHERQKKWIETTAQLATIIERAVGRDKRSKVHPATKVFQALRLYVNRELNNISAFLPMALNALSDNGRLVCISFHSLEDRLVKTFIRDYENKGELKNLTPKVICASKDEVRENPSSRSAKLRAAERI